MAKRTRATSKPKPDAVSETRDAEALAPASEDASVQPGRPLVSPEVLSDAVRDAVVAASDDGPFLPRPIEVPARSRPAPTGPPVELTIMLLGTELSEAKAPLVAAGIYEGLPPMGAAKALDQKLDSWISWAIEQKMISLGLGEIFHIPVLEKKIMADGVIIAGLGEAGRLDRDDYRLALTNVIAAGLCLGYDQIAMVLAGSVNRGLPLDLAATALIEAAGDAPRRVPQPPPDENRSASGEQETWKIRSEFTIVLHEVNASRFEDLIKIFRRFESPDRAVGGVRVHVVPGDPPTATAGAFLERDEPTRSDLMPSVPVTRITVAASRGIGPEAETDLTFQYSALTDSAVIPVREQVVDPYFADRLPGRIIASRTPRDQESYGRLLATYFLPEDFHRILDGPNPLTLILDSTTAKYPWEMAAMKGHHGTSFFGTDLRLTRQFRTLLSSAPGLPPPRDKHISALIIADPAPRPYQLDGARAEGWEVIRALSLAKLAWGESITIDVTARIGSAEEGPDLERDLRDQLAQIPGASKVVRDIAPCDPLQVLALLMNEQFDVIHFAGHGVYDTKSRRKGWIFDEGCVLSASEILKSRQVPRLVFANACHSSVVNDSEKPSAAGLPVEVGLAEAFFARGIGNYIGAGWKVHDSLARKFALTFYLESLGVELKPPYRVTTHREAPPATLGEAMASARRSVFPTGPTATAFESCTWGAYQHYGQVNDKLLSFTNVDGDVANQLREGRA